MQSYNLTDYEALREEFSWDDIYAAADWNAPEELNIAHEVCDRHADSNSSTALQYAGTNGEREMVTFAELTERSARFANVLESHGVEQGDRVFTYLPRIPAHYVALVGTLKRGAVFGGINERLGPDGIAYRLDDCDATAILTTSTNRDTVERALADVPSVETVITVDRGDDEVAENDVDYDEALAAASGDYDPSVTGGEDAALLYYTSGTTGLPKGVRHNHRWIAGVAATQRFAVDLHDDDLYWSTGDLGWLTGTINTLGAWFWGASLFTYEGEFDTATWADLLDEFPITVLFSVPTAYRMFRENEEVLTGTSLDLRHALSIGEPLSAGVVAWREDTLGVTIHDTYGQTETGNMIINNYPTMELRPGSMGKPLPGIEANIVDPETGEPMAPDETGEIAQRGDYPCFFAGFWESPEKHRIASSTAPRVSGISQATLPPKTRTATSGSKGGPTTSSSHQGTASARSKSSPRWASTRPSPKPPSFPNRTQNAGTSSRPILSSVRGLRLPRTSGTASRITLKQSSRPTSTPARSSSSRTSPRQ